MSSENTILIVDDTPTNLGILFDFLAYSGFKVLVAQDGESAIQKVEYAMPDLILLDVIMPGIDGFETCQRLKANKLTQDIPVIFMTALSETVDKIKGLNLGAVDYITKPFQHEEILARINIHLMLRNLSKKLQQQNVLLEKEIEERKQADQKICEQAALLDITTDAIIVQDLQNKILFWNKGAERLYGWTEEEAIAQNINQLLNNDNLVQVEANQKLILEQGEWQGELYQTTKDGKKIVVSTRWSLVCDRYGQSKSILTVNTDITEKKQLEAQFLRAQRMESIGTLASGIAHDLNNALSPILMSVQLLRTRINDQLSQNLLKTLEINTRRSADLVKQVLSFARGIEGEREIIQIEYLFLEINHIIQQIFPLDIQIRTEPVDPDVWKISGDFTQLHQVLMNLCVNARDAMPKGGMLGISAKNIWIDEINVRKYLDAKVGPYVVITVIDTGNGIPAHILDRVFEPFFTTKELGKGTGLGLSTVTGIVKSHGGFIEVVSEVNKGTKFNIYLPAMQTQKMNTSVAVSPKILAGKGELILVIDDEDSIREVTKLSLENYNYQVLTASDGIEGIAFYAQYKKDISVVLVDMMMPLMDGITTIRTLQKMNPKVKIIAVSGLMANYKQDELLDDNVKLFLSKPYSSEKLLESLSTVIAIEA